MATAYTTGASKIAAGIQPKTLAKGDVKVFSTFNLATNAPASASGLALNDTLYMMRLEADPSSPNGLGPTITSVVLDVPSLDSSTGIVTAVGDDSSGSFAANYISAASVGQSSTAGIQGINVHGGYGKQPFSGLFGSYTTVSLLTCNIIIKVTTGPTGTAAITGTIGLMVGYTMDP